MRAQNKYLIIQSRINPVCLNKDDSKSETEGSNAVGLEIDVWSVMSSPTQSSLKVLLHFSTLMKRSFSEAENAGQWHLNYLRITTPLDLTIFTVLLNHYFSEPLLPSQFYRRLNKNSINIQLILEIFWFWNSVSFL